MAAGRGIHGGGLLVSSADFVLMRPLEEKESSIEVHIDLPAAWFLLPLDASVVSDPDIVDDPPRYKRAPKGGWAAIGAAVLGVYAQLQESVIDPLAPELVLDYAYDGRLSREQKWIVGTWFGSEAPTLGLGESWTNGRHRSWGLKAVGFQFAPALLIPLCDAIRLWHPDLNNGWIFEAEDLRSQKREFAQWQASKSGQAWRAANPATETRWSAILDRWVVRLDSTAVPPI